MKIGGKTQSCHSDTEFTWAAVGQGSDYGSPAEGPSTSMEWEESDAEDEDISMRVRLRFAAPARAGLG